MNAQVIPPQLRVKAVDGLLVLARDSDQSNSNLSDVTLPKGTIITPIRQDNTTAILKANVNGIEYIFELEEEDLDLYI